MALGALTNAFIGICLIFASVSLLVSTVTEGLASWLKLRSATLLDGLKSMLNAQDSASSGWLRSWVPPIRGTLAQPETAPAPLSGLALLHGLFDHAAINPLGPGNADPSAARVAPSYVDPSHFAAALIDVVCQNKARNSFADVSAAIDQISDPQIKGLLLGAVSRAGGELDKLHQEVAHWFDAAMDRVGGDYKRYVQFWSLLIGLIFAISFNLDAIAVVHALLTNPALAASIQVTDLSHLPDAIQIKDYGVPIGWTPATAAPWVDLLTAWNRVPSDLWSVAIQIVGWLIMAVAALFGAPFWFDTLQRFVQLRGTGDKPGAKDRA
jgi:hypothetical protein